MHWMLVAAFLVASGIPSHHQQARRPACNAASAGRFWPDQANSDPTAARKLSQCGALEICSASVWKYKWQPATVNIRQLGKSPLPPSPECARLTAVGELPQNRDREGAENDPLSRR